MAMGKLYQEMLHQAGILAYRDAFLFLATLLCFMAVGALFMPNNLKKKEVEADKAAASEA